MGTLLKKQQSLGSDVNTHTGYKFSYLPLVTTKKGYERICYVIFKNKVLIIAKIKQEIFKKFSRVMVL